MAIWLMATVGGLGLFLLLSRRAPRLENLGTLGRQSPPLSAPGRGVTQQAVPRRVTSPPRGEAQMARWLRPSVQAARHAEPGRYPSQSYDEADED